MADFPVHANAQIIVIESDGSTGAYYNANLSFLPRIGETIQLTSNLDLKDGYEYHHSLCVNRLEHHVHDITGDQKGSYVALIYATRLE